MMAWSARTLLATFRPTFLGIVWSVCLMIAAGLLGFLVAAVAVAIFLPPVYRWRGVKNGAPYAIGDEVQILAGPHQGRLVRVYEVSWDRLYVRVELGDQERRQLTDGFSNVQVCRRQTVQ